MMKFNLLFAVILGLLATTAALARDCGPISNVYNVINSSSGTGASSNVLASYPTGAPCLTVSNSQPFGPNGSVSVEVMSGGVYPLNNAFNYTVKFYCVTDQNKTCNINVKNAKVGVKYVLNISHYGTSCASAGGTSYSIACD